jgi:methionyl-tRNA formyltransferase
LKPLRVGFAGTPGFAAEALAAILDAGFAVPVVLTQPDRPRGRGLRLTPSAVKQLAGVRGIPVLQPSSLKAEGDRAEALGIPLDVLVVAAYGLILPQSVLSWPRFGALNIHASKLPRWRGAAPIQRAIMAGDAVTGITVMQMDAGLDTGAVVDAVDLPIAPRETAGTLTTEARGVGRSPHWSRHSSDWRATSRCPRHRSRRRASRMPPRSRSPMRRSIGREPRSRSTA